MLYIALKEFKIMNKLKILISFYQIVSLTYYSNSQCPLQLYVSEVGFVCTMFREGMVE